MPASSDRPAPSRTLWSLVDEAARTRPDAAAVRHGAGTMTYRQLRDRVEGTARRLCAAGLGPGTTAGLLFDNTPDAVVAFLAVAGTGARLVPLEPDTGARALRELADELGDGAVLGSEARLRALSSADPAPAWTPVPTGEHGAPEDAGAGELPADADPEAPFLLQYTSGSTGAPKAAVHSQANLVRGGEIYRRTFGVTEADRVLAAVPLLHSFGMVSGLVTSLLSGACLVLTGRFVPARTLETLARDHCTVLLATPLAYDLLARAAAAGGPRPDRLRLCLSSGAPLPAEVADRFRARCGQDVQQIYGSTEAGIIACQVPEDTTTRERGVGRPAPGVSVRLTDDEGRPVPEGTAGQLLVRTPAMFAGYLGQPAVTAGVLLPDGWYVTGDIARSDEDGRLHLVGRKDSFINVGGKKVNPHDVEHALTAHPDVAEAVVWGEDLGGLGQRVRATVVATAELTAHDLTAHCRARLLPHQVPGQVEFVTEIPRTSLGKIRRAAVARSAGDAGTSLPGGPRA